MNFYTKSLLVVTFFVNLPAIGGSLIVPTPIQSTDFVAVPVSPPPVWVPSSKTLTHMEWDVVDSDGTVRNTLKRWADFSGWTFRPEHWDVPRDFPIQGTTTVFGDFKTAVRQLLASTDLTDHPIQPCFYSNNVLRVVDRSVLCDRMNEIGSQVSNSVAGTEATR